MKIYVITKGCYSDYSICAVSTNKEEAESLAEIYTDRFDTATIEEFDTENNAEVIKYKTVFKCVYEKQTKSIKVEEAYLDSASKGIINSKNYLTTYIRANAHNEALKFASDRFSKYIAEKMNL